MKRFQLPVIPRGKSKNVYFPTDVLNAVDEVIKSTDCTFSAFIVAATRAALADLKEQEKSNG